MVMQIIPLRPNARKPYQDKVKDLCKLLEDEEGKYYRVEVFRLLSLHARAFRREGLTNFKEHSRAKIFLRTHPAEVRAIRIIEEIAKIYSNGLPADEIDQLRGAVGEVFSFSLCKRAYSNAEIEVQVKVDDWRSGSIDTAGCTKSRGHCLQSKSSANDLESIKRQKRDFDKIDKMTVGKAEGIFITYITSNAFLMALNTSGIDSSRYKVYGRQDLAVLEELLVS